ncbi:MAG TPA: C25 family cysteine peptidase [Thermoanaerobaculia bacterium]|jgi:hypothetical protein|nr:C25 family cysteine peptidase [Thermoanaerobaculia bacterium]
MIRIAPFTVFGLFALASASGAAPPDAAVACPTFRIDLEQPGVYRVDHADLAAAGLSGPLPSAALALSDRGRPVPIWIEDGGDGRFGPGDHLEFRGERLPGARSAENEYTATHVYVLSCAPERAARMQRAEPVAPLAAFGIPGTPRTAGRWLRREHLEEDRILVRLTEGDARGELWFWHKLASIDAAPFELPLDLSGLDAAGGRSIAIRVHLRGWSKPAAQASGFPDHRVEVNLDGHRAAVLEWNEGDGARTFDLPPIAAGSLAGRSGLPLSLRVSPRTEPGGELFADVALLDWIEVEVPHSGRMNGAPLRLEIDPEARGPLPVLGAGSLVAYGDDGSRTDLNDLGDGGASKALAATPGAYDLVPRGALARPAAVELDRPSSWRSADHRADLLIVGPAQLLPAIAPLAERRRRQGLAVEVADVQDLYDEWSFGEVDPRAIQAFVAHAVKEWKPPAPRYLLIVGDASWDGKNPPGTETEAPDAAYRAEHGAEFAHVPATPYRGLSGGRARNLVPTWSYETGDGHAAGDNFFVDVDGDLFPELAVGRFPVVEPAEVAGIVEKIRRYEEASAGPWQRAVTFVTSEDPGWQLWADELAQRAVGQGFVPRTVFAPPLAQGAQVSPERADAQAVAAALGAGGYLLHFVGHGGRFVWRTGPPDWQRQRDLFNLDDLDRLPASDRLPIVVSMTCYSAPFDHPSADSIGEKLLRLPDRGAIAVIAAAWRVSPTQLLSQIVVGELLGAGPEERLGDALLRAKKRSYNRDFLQQYNLLGDPSLPLTAVRAVADPAPGIAISRRP